jgi:hypothetical protein
MVQQYENNPDLSNSHNDEIGTTRKTTPLSGPDEGASPSIGEITPKTPVAPDNSTKNEVAPPTPQTDIASVNDVPPTGLRALRLARTGDGITYAVINEKGNPYLLPIRSKEFFNFVRTSLAKSGEAPKSHQVQEVIEQLDANASIEGHVIDARYRVAELTEGEGIAIDLGDEKHTHVLVTPGNVEIVSKNSPCLFYRTTVCRPMGIPASSGDLSPLKKYVNLNDVDRLLLLAWISYTLAHPKIASSKYPILVLQGDQGTGKSSLVNNIILPLIDPTMLGMQVFPGNSKDLCIALQNTHVLAYDNMRGFNQSMSDILCIASTGGAISNRALYTNSDISLQPLHGALILNGIHSFVTHSDLAQRCLSVRTKELPEKHRKSEAEIAREYQDDFPIIFRGVLDLIAKVFLHIDDVELKHPERMIDFVRWLAAMEKVDGAPSGTYQAVYSSNLNDAQLDSLLEHTLADAVFRFATEHISGSWSGTPSRLLNELNDCAQRTTQHSRDWPHNAISLSKKLNSLKASFKGQGIEIEFTRGKQRTITITNLGDF